MSTSLPSPSPTPLSHYVLPSVPTLAASRTSLHTHLPAHGHGDFETQYHLLHTIVPALNSSSKSPHYYGFVTGGATPIAAFADHLVTEHDQNVQVHLPNESIATDVEAAALQMVAELIDPVHIGAEGSEWRHRTFTTGATASNVLGLALGREFVVQQAGLKATGSLSRCSVADNGLFDAMRAAGLEKIQILTSTPHSSLRKAASLAGLGRSCLIDIGHADASHRIDLTKLESALQTPRTASIIAISAGEVNTGFFATNGPLMSSIAALAAKYNAWIHVDAAFGLPASLLPPTPEFETVREGVQNLHLAHSITADAHKMLNVPYDCGIFFSRYLDLAVQVCQNPNAAYLASGPDGGVPSPLNIGIENSRRFRALPVYASLTSLGRDGYTNMIVRQVRLARKIAAYIDSHPGLELLNGGAKGGVYNIVLFRAKSVGLNAELTSKINATRIVYVSGTVWRGEGATRIAVANWGVDVDRDFEVVKGVLDDVLEGMD